MHRLKTGFSAGITLAVLAVGCNDSSPQVLTDTGTTGDSSTADAGVADASTAACRINADCDTGETCRTGTCDQTTGECTYTTLSNFCYVSGVCYGDGAEDPANACRYCDSATLVEDFTYRPGKAGWTNQLTVIDETTSVNECVDPCIEYCDAINAACTGDLLAQYSEAVDSTPTADQVANLDPCRTYCENWQDIPPTGNPASSNSIDCRLANALEAQKSPEDALLLCPIAGPTGGDQCGSWCDNYCQLALQNCASASPAFSSLETCMTECANLSTDGAAGDTTGDTVQCRIHYLGIVKIPAKGSANCANGIPGASPTCVDNVTIPGDTCGTPRNVTAVPFFGTGTTKGSTSDYEICVEPAGSGLDSAGTGAPDHIWLINGASIWGDTVGTVNLTITVTPEFAATIYLLDGTCGGALNCTAPIVSASTPTTAIDESGTVTPTPIVLTFEMQTTDTRWLVVDGLTTPGAEATATGTISGEYTVNVEAGPTCAAYCTKVMGACSGDFAQYVDEADCLEWCSTRANIPPGSTDDTYGNSIGCRLWHAVSAETVGTALNLCTNDNLTIASTEADLGLLCEAAGPFGGATCGSACDVYCDLSFATCTGVSSQYADRDACAKACLNMEAGQYGATAGDSLECRLNTLSNAVLPAEPTTEPLAECQATGAAPVTGCVGQCPADCAGKVCGLDACGNSCGTCPAGQVCSAAGACTGDCERYCDLLSCHCSGGGFATPEECLAGCVGGQGPGLDTTTLECLSHHAALAKTDATHCTLASGETSIPSCASWCGHYCELAMAQCTGDNALFADANTCLTECATLNVAGATSAYDVVHVDTDTVQCRVDYLTQLTGDNPTSTAAVACPAAAIVSTTCTTN